MKKNLYKKLTRFIFLLYAILNLKFFFSTIYVKEKLEEKYKLFTTRAREL